LQERSRIASARRGIRVSVIIPVFNGMPLIGELLASLDDQGLQQDQLQVIIVDDGSTDGTADHLDDYAATRSHVTVLHQENSGWPGQPRNRALAVATGRWVFFADADDWFAPRALLELVEFGDLQDAQIVLPRVKRCGTRHGTRFTETLTSTPKRQAFRTFTPHKLVRRDLITSADLRFPEGKVRLEDGIFLTRCYLLAERISVLADRDLYYFRGRDDGRNISAQRLEPQSYVASLDAIAQNVYDLSRGPKMRTALITELLRRKCLRHYTDQRFARYPPQLQQQWLEVHAAFLSRHLTSEVRDALSARNVRRAELIMAGDRDGLLADIIRDSAAAVASAPSGSDAVPASATSDGQPVAAST
jgi:glycosyltransferase involved in cell wall biosynthesis